MRLRFITECVGKNEYKDQDGDIHVTSDWMDSSLADLLQSYSVLGYLERRGLCCLDGYDEDEGAYSVLPVSATSGYDWEKIKLSKEECQDFFEAGGKVVKTQTQQKR